MKDLYLFAVNVVFFSASQFHPKFSWFKTFLDDNNISIRSKGVGKYDSKQCFSYFDEAFPSKQPVKVIFNTVKKNYSITTFCFVFIEIFLVRSTPKKI